MTPAASPAALRVQAALGERFQVLEFDASTRTAADAAAAIGCTVAEIAKSLIFRGAESNRPVLVVASGACRVDETKVAAAVGETIARADADFVREATGFAIGGVPPVGHKTPPIALIDESLMALRRDLGGRRHAERGLSLDAVRSRRNDWRTRRRCSSANNALCGDLSVPRNTRAKIRIGVGGWTYEPWRGAFYPKGLPHSRELEYAGAKLTSIEINGTYYGSQKPESFAKWRDETPDDFVFSVKGPRFATNRRVLAEAGELIERFFKSGVTELKSKLGPINWQFATTKRFDPDDFAAFLKLLPSSVDGLAIRHAVEVRNESFRNAGLRRARASAQRRGRDRRRLRVPANRRRDRAIRLCAHHGNGRGGRGWISQRRSRSVGRARQDVGRRRLSARPRDPGGA